tara:strand:- start:667 stop:897 length:231 start_codon:yes stop_codon:yes gene_type:complete
MHPIGQEIDRFQLFMMDLEYMVDQNSYVRLVDLFVKSFPFKELRYVLILQSLIKVSEADLKNYFERKQRLKNALIY